MKILAPMLVSICLLSTERDSCQVPGTERWEVTAAGPILSSPAIAEDGTIYFGAGEVSSPSIGWLYSISPQGTTNWSLSFPGAVQSSPAIGYDGTIYVGCWNGELKVVSPAGKLNLKIPTGGHILASPAIGADGTIYIGSVSNLFNKLYAVSPQGEIKWVFSMGSVMFSAPGSIQFSSPVIGPDRTIYVGSIDKNLYAVNPDGTTNWVFALLPLTNSPPESGSPTYASPAIGPDGTIYIGADNGIVYAIDHRGFARWKFPVPSQVETSAAIGSDGTVYTGSLRWDGTLYALSRDGTLKWSFATDGISASPAIASDGTVYVVGYATNRLFAFSSSGSYLWSFPTAEWMFSSPAIGLDGTIYFGAGSKLYALYGSNSLLNSSWPMFRRDAQHSARAIQRGIQKPRALTDGNLAMSLITETNRVYSVEYSTNLVQWTELTNFLSDAFFYDFIDLGATNSAQRYYRLETATP